MRGRCLGAGPCPAMLADGRGSYRSAAWHASMAKSGVPLCRRRRPSALAAPCCFVRTSSRLVRGRIVVCATPGGMGDDELDVAVFRFTLGIPGFDDREIPRVTGVAACALLLVNHLASMQPVDGAQARAEMLCALLAAICLVIPWLEERLREVLPSRGRQQSGGDVAGSNTAFLLAPELDEESRRELAWASFALLKNTNSCATALVAGDRCLMARGALAARSVLEGSSDGPSAVLEAVARDVRGVRGGKLAEILAPAEHPTAAPQALWLADPGDMQRMGADKWEFVPEGVQSLLVQGLGGSARGALLAMSERPRGLSEKDQQWVAQIASKLSSCPAVVEAGGPVQPAVPFK